MCAKIVTPVRPTRKRKAYVGDMTPSDFKTPQSVQKNLMFIKNKFRDVSVKVKKLQDQNRWANRRVKKILDSLETLNAKGLISNNVLTTVHKFTHNLVRTHADCRRIRLIKYRSSFVFIISSPVRNHN